MDGELPEIFWYLFWIGFVILAFRMAYLGGKAGYDTKMKALEILKIYAEKGADPPPAMMDHLAKQVFEQPRAAKSDSKDGLLPAFIGFLFLGCVSWTVLPWLASGDAPAWQRAAVIACAAFFGIGALGFLLAALITRRK